MQTGLPEPKADNKQRQEMKIVSAHATLSEPLPERGQYGARALAKDYRLSVEALSSQLDLSQRGSSALLLSRALELVTEADRMLADQRARIDLLERLSVTDELTELYNRRGFFRQMERQFALARRHAETGVLAMLDLDDFKAINDTHGHVAGDRVLMAVAARIRTSLRETDIIARLGGDEFAIGLTRSSAEGGLRQASRIVEGIGELTVTVDGKPISLAASIGAAPYDGHRSLDEIMAEADRALYTSKRRKRRARRRARRAG